MPQSQKGRNDRQPGALLTLCGFKVLGTVEQILRIGAQQCLHKSRQYSFATETPHLGERPTNLVLVGIVFVRPQSELEQPVLPRILERLVKVLVSGLRDVAQSRRVPAEVVVDAVSLHMMRKSTERSQERQILARILSERREGEISQSLAARRVKRRELDRTFCDC